MLTRETSRTYDYNDYRTKEKYSKRVDIEAVHMEMFFVANLFEWFL